MLTGNKEYKESKLTTQGNNQTHLEYIQNVKHILVFLKKKREKEKKDGGCCRLRKLRYT